ncbi:MULTISPECIES: lipid A biosynthesis lauroyl acyltransferase [unclassified Campylobacter]|uniref:lipid A biosynthesis lauroyl acyltransferase n=1 Tax=unclassified Campylobacter TaxID=2593542 RepID=UPI0022EA0009|nr:MULTISPECIES: lipid A biosynthesis lauroyl acyltransferase [unclassified Campylobacter]MDA3079461.1 lipid A biosynthesis lauroyl acyltransferase [Campylobacter sp. CS_NA2]MDA3081106.1 lipid A biosynthesis lauroyl acyltransferase [Campylobacter sp. CS_NA1]MDA3085657.1 lipid A biosynthesis lauroyl acyltransferase [Campylobacter sp. CS_ED1]MDA3090295.1 lipid A biosynthesis lauroyl acyltransferase [Campylobacter sp. CS_ED2]WBR50922.1 lipid A biosynthesis lauroyl acyltransferase [Campylobacter s
MDKFYLFLYKFFNFVVNALPNKIVLGFLNFIAFCFYKFDKKHYRIMSVNLGFCFPNLNKNEIDKIIKSTYKNFAFFAYDFLKNQNLDKDQILAKVNFINSHFLENSLNSGRPIIVQTAHYGNWEIMGLAMGAKFGKMSIVGRKLDSVAMDKILTKNRVKFDIELISKKGGAKEMLRALKNGRMLGILVDQNAGNEGIECEFFGKKIMHTPAASVFAQKLNALIVPFFARRNGESMTDIEFYEPIDINEISENAVQVATQMQSDATKKVIEAKPDEYFWMHKKFNHYYEESYK